MTKKNGFVVGLDNFNLQMLKSVRNAEHYNFIGLLDIHRLIDSGGYRLNDMLEMAEKELDAFDGKIDAIVGYTDFPVSVMVPILCEKYSVPGPSLESVLKCEHKYWSRLEQRKVVADNIPQFYKFSPFDDDALQQIPLQFPFWVKPIKSTASQLGFRINNQKDFDRAMKVVREKIGLFKPFDTLLGKVQLPDEVAKVNSSYCVAEQIISGRQVTLEGYVYKGQVRTYGIIDSIREANRTTFSRYQYPTMLPRSVQNEMSRITEEVMKQVGFDNSAFNLEFFWNEKQKKVWLLEINTRIPQSHSDLFVKVDGVSNHQIMLDVALGQDPWFPKRQGKFNVAAKFFLREYKDKLITAIPTKDELEQLNRELPGTLIDFQGNVGMKLSEIPEQDSYSYAIAFIYLGGKNQKELKDKYRRCVQSLNIQYRDLNVPYLPSKVEKKLKPAQLTFPVPMPQIG